MGGLLYNVVSGISEISSWIRTMVTESLNVCFAENISEIVVLNFF